MQEEYSNLTNIDTIPPASLFYRLAAMVYDSFVLFSLLLLLTSIALVINKGESLLPYRIYFLGYLFVGMGLFLSWFWHRGGQTLGMLAWKIRVVDRDGQPISFRRAFLRYSIAYLSVGLGAIGLLWIFVDKDKQALHDRLAHTRVIRTKVLRRSS